MDFVSQQVIRIERIRNNEEYINKLGGFRPDKKIIKLFILMSSHSPVTSSFPGLAAEGAAVVDTFFFRNNDI